MATGIDLAERRLRVLAGRPVGTLLIHEIYASIQGESTYVGLPCTFVRLTGCPLRCRWCDSPLAFHQGAPMTPADVLARVAGLAPNLVEITGGEPLSQPEVFPLMSAIADTGRKVLLETAGSEPIENVDRRVTIIMDLKCPSSGELSANRLENLAHLKPEDEIKFVIGDRADFDWSEAMIREHGLLGRPLLFSPVFGELEYRELCAWILERGLPARFQLQLHKHVWDPKAKGV